MQLLVFSTKKVQHKIQYQTITMVITVDDSRAAAKAPSVEAISVWPNAH